MDIKGEKKELRRNIKFLKSSVTGEELEKSSLIIQNKVLELPQIRSAETILLYHSLPDEVDTSLLLERLSNRLSGSKRVLLPVVNGDILLIKEFVPQSMNCGYRNIMEPVGESVSPLEIDIAVIPGVAFDKFCNRMGRGKGFYDRLLPSLNCGKIGLGFGFQVVDNIPCEPFDYPLDMVITEKESYISPLRFV